MLIITAKDQALHHGSEMHHGALVPSFESPLRLERIDAALRAAGFDRFTVAQPIDRSLIERVHDADYVAFLEHAFERWQSAGHDGDAMAHTWPTRRLGASRPDGIVGQLGYYSFAADCAMTSGTFAAAMSAAGAAADAADEAMQSGAAFAMVRPPGHHATRNQFGGYCYLNNAAIAAQRLLEQGAARVAVLDIDYHHGNGTQDIFYTRSDVLTVSIHADPARQFPWFIGYAGETGSGAGEGANLNLPLPRGTGFDEWRMALDVALQRIREQRCDALVVALGVDTFAEDPISDFKLTTADYPVIGARIESLKLPTAFVMEGGYITAALGANVAGVLSGFVNPASV